MPGPNVKDAHCGGVSVITEWGLYPHYRGKPHLQGASIANNK